LEYKLQQDKKRFAEKEKELNVKDNNLEIKSWLKKRIGRKELHPKSWIQALKRSRFNNPQLTIYLREIIYQPCRHSKNSVQYSAFL